MLSGFEAINGIMLIGWSTAFMYSLIQNIYKSTSRSLSDLQQKFRFSYHAVQEQIKRICKFLATFGH